MSREFPGGFPPAHNVDGSWGGLVTEVPIELIQRMSLPPIPATWSGTSERTFTLNASVTNPVMLWNANQVVSLTHALTYAWVVGTNATLDSDGAEADLTNGTVGVWYQYVYTTSAGVETLIPSLTAPSWVQHTYMSYLGHPGTSATRSYRYVGFQICTATTPTFSAGIKVGKWWNITEVNQAVITDAWTAPTKLTLYIPKLAFAGGKVGGTVETGAEGTIHLGAHTASTLFSVQARVVDGTTDSVAKDVIELPFRMVPNDSTSPIYAIAAPAGDIHITTLKDAV